jgi:hypothetical protein
MRWRGKSTDAASDRFETTGETMRENGINFFTDVLKGALIMSSARCQLSFLFATSPCRQQHAAPMGAFDNDREEFCASLQSEGTGGIFCLPRLKIFEASDAAASARTQSHRLNRAPVLRLKTPDCLLRRKSRHQSRPRRGCSWRESAISSPSRSAPMQSMPSGR